MSERDEIITRLTKAIEKWDKCPRQTLKRLFPDEYLDMKRKIEDLRNGADYTKRNVAPEMVYVFGGFLATGATYRDKRGVITCPMESERFQDGLKQLPDSFKEFMGGDKCDNR